MDAGLAAIAGTLAGVAFTQVVQSISEQQRQRREDRRHWITIRREVYGQFIEAANRTASAGSFVLDVIRKVGTIPANLDLVLKAAASTYGITLAELQHPLRPGIIQPSAFIDRFANDLEHYHSQIRLIGSPSAKQKANEVFWFAFSNYRMKIIWATIGTVAKSSNDEQSHDILEDALKQVNEGDMQQVLRDLSRRISEFEAAARSDLGV